jgi:uncharacterized protein YigE (DUF2233 family)
MSARLLVLLTLLLPATAFAWGDLAPGLSYQHMPKHNIQAFKIDLKKMRLQIVQATDKGTPSDSVANLAQGSEAMLAVNGGFFTNKWRSLGLLVSGGKKLNALRQADWGVLSVNRNGRAQLLHTKKWRPKNTPEFAIQAGPRLVVGGRVLSLKEQHARRTAVGILPGGRQIVILVADSPISLESLARLMKDVMGCNYAINLDGGSSTQLWSSFGSVRPVSGLPVTNIVVVTQRR